MNVAESRVLGIAVPAGETDENPGPRDMRLQPRFRNPQPRLKAQVP
jgi:hypothetical protein